MFHEQLEEAIKKAYTDTEVIEALVKEMKPGMQLISYLEIFRDLALPHFRQILISHCETGSGAKFHENLATIC